MAQYRIFKETALPGTLTAHSIYFVAPAANPGYLEIYVTDAAGTAHRRIHTEADIQSLIDTAIDGLNTGAIIVDNITQRDALTDKKNGDTVLVIDASGDGTVTSGAATYVWRSSNTSWVKISEHESLDMSLTWANLSGKPTSTVAAIDSAVTNSHTHANKTQLDKISETGGLLYYNGQLPAIGWNSSNW
jgi:hypothetical protein